MKYFSNNYSTSAYPDTIRGGQLGGPVVFFDKAYSAVVLISPLNNFMVSNMEVKMKNNKTVLDFGLMGSIQVNSFLS